MAAPSPSPIQTLLSALESHQNQLLRSRAKNRKLFYFRRSGITPCPEDESIFSYIHIVAQKSDFVNYVSLQNRFTSLSTVLDWHRSVDLAAS